MSAKLWEICLKVRWVAQYRTLQTNKRLKTKPSNHRDFSRRQRSPVVAVTLWWNSYWIQFVSSKTCSIWTNMTLWKRKPNLKLYSLTWGTNWMDSNKTDKAATNSFITQCRAVSNNPHVMSTSKSTISEFKTHFKIHEGSGFLTFWKALRNLNRCQTTKNLHMNIRSLTEISTKRFIQCILQ